MAVSFAGRSRVRALCVVEHLGQECRVVGVEAINENLQNRRPVPGSAEEPLHLPRDPVRFCADRRVIERAAGPDPGDLSLGVESVQYLGDCCVRQVAAETSKDLSGTQFAVLGPQQTVELEVNEILKPN